MLEDYSSSLHNKRSPYRIGLHPLMKDARVVQQKYRRRPRVTSCTPRVYEIDRRRSSPSTTTNVRWQMESNQIRTPLWGAETRMFRSCTIHPRRRHDGAGTNGPPTAAARFRYTLLSAPSLPPCRRSGWCALQRRRTVSGRAAVVEAVTLFGMRITTMLSPLQCVCFREDT